MTPNEAIRFLNRKPTGSARVAFPTLVGCPKCQGLAGINLAGEFIYDPKLAVFLSTVQEGYNLRCNEELAARGTFRYTGPDDEGMPDDWQGLCSPPQECTCGELGYLDACEALSRPWPEDVEIETEPSTPSDESVHFSGFDEEAAEAAFERARAEGGDEFEEVRRYA